MGDRHQTFVDEVKSASLSSPGDLDLNVRTAAAGTGEVPAPLAAYVDKVRRHAYRVTDDDVAALRQAGYSEDQIFELTVSAAVGAGLRRLDAGLAALKGAK